MTSVEQVERWKQASDRRKFWSVPGKSSWIATTEDETGKRHTSSAKTLERACSLLLAIMNRKGLV